MNKIFETAVEAVADIPDGAVIMIGGFAHGQGVPYNLINALVERKVKNLTVIANNYVQVNDLVREKLVSKAIISFEAPVRYDPNARFLEEADRNGEVEVEGVPQGTLSMRIWAWGAGIAGFYTRVGAGTLIGKGKEERIIDGQNYIFERALGADFALIKGFRSDTLGNLVYYKSARNINPVMAQGARIVIAEVDEIVEAGELDPEVIVTPGILVDRIVKAKSKAIPLYAVSQEGHMTRGTELGVAFDLVALRAMREIREGDVVFTGVGIPMQILQQEIISKLGCTLLSENGIVGHGPILTEATNWELEAVNAGGYPVVFMPGHCFISQFNMFSILSGKHRIDIALLGAYQVSEKGDLANWMLPKRGVRTIGGSMNVALGARRVVVIMSHTTRAGMLKIVKECSQPVTASGVVNLIITNLVVIEVGTDGLLLKEIAPGSSVEEVQALTEPKLLISDDLSVMEF